LSWKYNNHDHLPFFQKASTITVKNNTNSTRSEIIAVINIDFEQDDTPEICSDREKH
jgi:hypothetical protein